jgi:di/tricarboxylate transporter
MTTDQVILFTLLFCVFALLIRGRLRYDLVAFMALIAALTLMPLSFATILGGMITLIGTPPNIIIAEFRQQSTGTSFSMFDFAPVGLACAVVGVLFVATIGWRLLPARIPGTGRCAKTV